MAEDVKAPKQEIGSIEKISGLEKDVDGIHRVFLHAYWHQTLHSMPDFQG